jgi:hypothetical protein
MSRSFNQHATQSSSFPSSIQSLLTSLHLERYSRLFHRPQHQHSLVPTPTRTKRQVSICNCQANTDPPSSRLKLKDARTVRFLHLAPITDALDARHFASCLLCARPPQFLLPQQSRNARHSTPHRSNLETGFNTAIASPLLAHADTIDAGS